MRKLVGDYTNDSGVTDIFFSSWSPCYYQKKLSRSIREGKVIFRSSKWSVGTLNYQQGREQQKQWEQHDME